MLKLIKESEGEREREGGGGRREKEEFGRLPYLRGGMSAGRQEESR